jgi:hypothetical protein
LTAGCSFSWAKRDQALAQYMLHGLAEAEVDAKRQGGYQLGKPYLGGFASATSIHIADANFPTRAGADRYTSDPGGTRVTVEWTG